MSIAVLPPVNGASSHQSQEGTPPDARSAQAFGAALEAQRRTVNPGVTAARHTPLSADEAASAIRSALTRARGTAPKPETVAVLTAQWAHETAHGSRMFNYNFGGIKGSSPAGLSVMQRTREGWGADERQIVDRFRAYRSAEEGAADYVRLLETRYGAALTSAEAGDAAGFVRGLKAQGYFTGNEQAYARSVAQVAADFLGGRNVAPRANFESPANSAAGLNLEARSLAFAADGRAGVESLTSASFLQAQSLIDQLTRASLRSVAADGDADPEREPWR